MKAQIGAYEAKTRLPELLQQVKAGKQFTITNRGRAVADLVPAKQLLRKDKTETVARFREFMRQNPIRKKVDTRKLLEEGRM